MKGSLQLPYSTQPSGGLSVNRNIAIIIIRVRYNNPVILSGISGRGEKYKESRKFAVGVDIGATETENSSTTPPGKVLIPVPTIWEAGTKDCLEKTWGNCLLITGNSQDRQTSRM